MPTQSPYPDQLATDINLPDVRQYIDTYDAEDMNIVRAYIRDLTHTLGVNPHGSCPALVDRLAKIVDPDGNPVTPAQVITVGKNNAHFDSIQAAVDSITDAGASKRYTVLIYPGVYAETVSPKEYVDLIGSSMIMQDYYSAVDPMAQIAPPSGPCISNTTVGNLRMANLFLKFTDAPVFESSVPVTLNLVNCKIYNGSEEIPALSAQDTISLHARDTSIFTGSSHNRLVDIDTAQEVLLNYSFSRCILAGRFDVKLPDTAQIALQLNNCAVNGAVHIDHVSAVISIYYSELFSSYAAPVRLGAGDSGDTASQLYLVHSQLYSESAAPPVERIAGQNHLKLWAYFSTLYPELGTDIDIMTPSVPNAFNAAAPMIYGPL